MLVMMQPEATVAMQEAVIHAITQQGFQPFPAVSGNRTVITAVSDTPNATALHVLSALPGVEHVEPIATPYKLASRVTPHREHTIVTVQHVPIGGPEITVMAGPCSVESYDQVYEAAHAVKASGARILRGGAFKPRTSPYSFQGLAEDGLRILRDVGQALQLPIITECMAPEEVEMVAFYADIIQIGARNAQNFSLLKRVGKIKTPVLLKRGMSTTIEEFLLAAEYILAGGNANVLLCERGIRTFESATRNTLDLSAVPVLKAKCHLPVVIDPSHATGHWQYVPAMAKAAVAVGADGLLIEVHPHPERALCDGHQSLTPMTFTTMMQEIIPIAHAVGRQV